LNKIIDLKSALKGGVQKIQHCKKRVKRKKKLQEEKTKLVHITGDINLFYLFIFFYQTSWNIISMDVYKLSFSKKNCLIPKYKETA
jgi:hypothetical protein